MIAVIIINYLLADLYVNRTPIGCQSLCIRWSSVLGIPARNLPVSHLSF